MKGYLRYVILFLLCLGTFCACGQKEEENDLSTIVDEAYNMPVISIETVNQDSNKMDFVTKPVTKHVAQAIASWTPDYEMPLAPYYEDCTITLTDEAENTVLDKVEAEVKVRGNWTTSYDKKPLRIKFKKKQSMLGLNEGQAYKNWVLLAEYKDASMLRNKTALTIAGEILEKMDCMHRMQSWWRCGLMENIGVCICWQNNSRLIRAELILQKQRMIIPARILAIS